MLCVRRVIGAASVPFTVNTSALVCASKAMVVAVIDPLVIDSPFWKGPEETVANLTR